MLIDAFQATAWMRGYHYDGADLAAVLKGQIVNSAPRTHTVALGPDTTAITAVDPHGLGVVIVQSNGHAFGSRLATPDTNIFLHDRGAIGFNLIEGDANELRPRARPRHTLAPMTAQTPDGNLVMLAGTMGGDRQPSVLAQIITAALRDHQDPSDALSQPRFAFRAQHTGDLAGFDTFDGDQQPVLCCEEHLHSSVYDDLVNRYGPIEKTPAYGSDSGVAHLTVRGPNGWVIAADPRSEATGIAGY
jgi:gamma-glutamyltranspeptidase/glutathione hydrolase